MIHTVRYRGQTAPLICFDERQLAQIREKLQASGVDYCILSYITSEESVAKVKPRKPKRIIEIVPVREFVFCGSLAF